MKNLLRKIIGPAPNEYDELISKAVSFPRYTRHKFDFAGMTFTVTDFLSVAWQIKEIFQAQEMKFNAATDSPVIIDCGANVGVSVIYFRKEFPHARIIAYEPDVILAACLEENLSANNISQIDLRKKAAWINNDGISFGSDGADGGSVFLENDRHIVATERLKDVLRKENRIDLLKMDIEGAEVDVLLDCSPELSRIQNIFVEYHSWKHLHQRLDDMLRVLTESGFRYYIRSLGPHANPFIEIPSGAMDIQLNIHAVKIKS